MQFQYYVRSCIVGIGSFSRKISLQMDKGLCYNSAAVPAVGYIDASYSIFDDAISFIIAIASVWSIGVIITLALAVKHFYKVKKVTKGRYEELRPIKCNCTRKD